MKSYVLEADGKTPRAVTFEDYIAYAKEHKDQDWCRVALDVVGDVKVSTVFMHIDHRFGPGKPLLWETMIFGGAQDGYCDRYTSYDDAVSGHAKAVEIAKAQVTA